MKPTKVLQKIRKMRFKEAYEGWNAGRLTQAEAARILGICERSFRRYLWRYEECGLGGLTTGAWSKPRTARRRCMVYEAMALTDEYQRKGWAELEAREANPRCKWHCAAKGAVAERAQKQTPNYSRLWKY